MMFILYAIAILIAVILIIGLLQVIVWGGTALLCLISDAANMWDEILGGHKK